MLLRRLGRVPEPWQPPKTEVGPMTGTRLTIPSRSQIADPRVEIRPAELRKFLDGLPLTDVARACTVSADALTALNRQPLTAAQRLPLAELYRQSFKAILHLIDRRLQSAVSHGGRQITESLQAMSRLARELQFAYKILLTDALESQDKRTRERVLHTGLYRAMKFLGMELMFSFHGYSPAPSHAWSEINHIHELAARNRLADTAFMDDEMSTLPASSVAHLYKQIVLTARADPYRLASGEVWKVYRFLGRWAELAAIVGNGGGAHGPGCFLIDPEGQTAPLPPGSELADRGARRAEHVLDSGALAHWMDDQIRELEAGNLHLLEELHLAPSARESIRLLRYLIVAWSHDAKRQHERKERFAWVEGVCGLSAAHRLMQDLIEPPSLVEQPAEETEPDEDSTTIDIRASGRFKRKENQQAEPQERWRLINHSTGGVALGVRVPFSPTVRVGQIVLFRNPAEREAQWLTGIIRWLSQEQEDEIKMGVQYLSDNASPVIVDDSADGEDRQLPALWVEVKQAERPMPPQLITPHGVYQQDREIVIQRSHRPARVRASKLIEATSSLDRFYFESLSA